MAGRDRVLKTENNPTEDSSTEKHKTPHLLWRGPHAARMISDHLFYHRKTKPHLKRTPLMTCHAFGAGCCCCGCCCCWGSWASPAVCTAWLSAVAALPLLLTCNRRETRSATEQTSVEELITVSNQRVSSWIKRVKTVSASSWHAPARVSKKKNPNLDVHVDEPAPAPLRINLFWGHNKTSTCQVTRHAIWMSHLNLLSPTQRPGGWPLEPTHQHVITVSPNKASFNWKREGKNLQLSTVLIPLWTAQD